MSRTNKYTDKELIHLIAKNKDRKAWETLYYRYHIKIFSYFMRLSKGNKSLSEDILQDVFIKLFDKAWQYNSDFAFSTWLFTIASNTLKSTWKKENKIEHGVDHLSTPSSSISPEDASNEALVKDQIEHILNLVSLEHKETYVLRYQECFSTREVADILETSEGTVKSRLFKVTQLITKHFKSNKKS